MKTNLEGKHVLVTGGSRGIGNAIVRAFVDEGANVSYCSRKTQGDEFVDLHSTSSVCQVAGSSVDIADPGAIQEWVRHAAERFGQIDCVVTNASPIVYTTDAASWEASFRADVLGLVTLIEAATPHLARQASSTGDASIVVISSMVGWEKCCPVVGTPYTAFKRAQGTIARDYVRTLSPKGIRINVIVPGMIRVESIPIKEEDLPGYLSMIPLGRAGMPQDIANTTVFLSSVLSKFTTGAIVFMDGGMSTSL